MEAKDSEIDGQLSKEPYNTLELGIPSLLETLIST